MWFFESLYADIKIGVKGNRIYKKRTPYQKMEFYNTPRFGNVLTLDGAIQTTDKDEFIYHEMMSHPVLLLHPQPQKVLIVGGGDGGVLREVLKYDLEQVFLVEIDKEVIRLSQRYLKRICRRAFKDNRLNLVIADGAEFLRQTKEKFDIVIVDSPDPVGAAKVLFSKRFYSDIASVLRKKGIMIRQSGSTILQAEELRTNFRILKGLFPFVAVQIAAIPTYIGGFFSFLIASKKINPQIFNIKRIKKRFNALQLKTYYYNPTLHRGSLCLPTYIRSIIE